MGASTSASSSKDNNFSMAASTGGTPNIINQNAKIKRAGKKADEFAREKLGITQTGNAIFATNTGGNQMYGSEYQKARNEYLASQGLGTINKETGSFTAGVQTDKGLTFTDTTRGAYREANRYRIPLSKQMFESQQKFQMGLAGVTALAGVPLIPSILLSTSQTPYSSYINSTSTRGFYDFSDSPVPDKNKTQGMTPPEANQFNTMTEAEREAERKRRRAASGQGDLAANTRSLFSTIAQTFGGSG
tara:strand:+ start:5392 stop:6129 length:738 start_codon:yes stop_codon:yes gene_type:complete